MDNLDFRMDKPYVNSRSPYNLFICHQNQKCLMITTIPASTETLLISVEEPFPFYDVDQNTFVNTFSFQLLIFTNKIAY